MKRNLYTYIGLGFAFGSYLALFGLAHFGISTTGGLAAAAVNIALWSCLLVWAARVEEVSLASLGFKLPTIGTFVWGFLATVVIFLVMGMYYQLVTLMGGNTVVPEMASELASLNIATILVLTLTIGISEELLFRAYPISRIYALTKRKWIAWVVPIFVFSALHIPSMGLAQFVPVVLGAIVFTVLFWLRRDYWCNVLAHFLVDFTAFGAMVAA